jgi:protein O-GlcNAc transferase
MRYIRMMLLLLFMLLPLAAIADDMGGFAVEDAREKQDMGYIRSLFQKGEYEKVIAYFDKFQRDYPRSPNMPEVKFYLGLSLMKLGDYKESLSVLLAIMTAAEENPPDQLYEAIGIDYLNIGDYPHAEEWLLKAEASNTDPANVDSALGNLYYATNDFAKAETYFKKAVALNPELVEAQNNLGLIYMRQKKYEDAKEHFLAVLKTGKKLETAYFNLGLIAMLEKDYYAAANNFKLLVTLSPDVADYHTLYGRALEGQRKYNDALAEAEAALKIDPKHKGALALKSSVTKKINK